MTASPCRNICRIDDASGWCVGCGRSLAEITAWMRLTGREREAVMQRLPARLALLPEAERAALSVEAPAP